MLGGRAFIRTPVLFPSGATVVVVIHDEGGGWFRVSDLGQGHDEADTLGIAPLFRAQAKEMAARIGVQFDGHAFLVAGIAPDQLVGAAMAVANGASRAFERAARRGESRRPIKDVDRLVSRLAAVFPDARIERETELRGASTHAWGFDATVVSAAGRSVFDIVTPHPTSIAFAATKFQDVVARLEDAPARVAVVHRKESLGDLLAVVAQVARVVEDDDPDAVFRTALAA